MARIVVKDLHESIELDRKAMKNIHGGARGAASGTGYQQRTRIQHPRAVKPRFFPNK